MKMENFICQNPIRWYILMVDIMKQVRKSEVSDILFEKRSEKRKSEREHHNE